ncbi:MAG: glycosyl hydrolase 53 family protein [Bacteroidetes bacterium]|nr:glycosyl hydrolase 53 family protein [Bacteroidota bacterium]
MFRLLAICSLAIGILMLPACRRSEEKVDLFVRGADVSFLPDIEASGYVLRNSAGKAEDPLATLQKAGVNTIRIRVWNHQAHPVSSPQVVAGRAERCRQLELRVMLSLHYSDTWADPGNQQKPAAWQGIPFDALRDSVYDFTYRITKTIRPEYIQVGNEINGGFLWPDGSSANHQAFVQLLQAGVSAVRAANPGSRIILHYAGIDGAPEFFGRLSEISYDLAGLSYYPYWHGTSLETLSQTIRQLKAQTGREVIVAETAYPFSLQWNDNTHNVIGQPEQLLPGYPATPQGQRDFVCRIRQLAEEAGATGFCYWGAEWVSYKGPAATNGSSWENQALWDFEGKALPAMDCFRK